MGAQPGMTAVRVAAGVATALLLCAAAVMMTDTISIDKVTGEFQILAKGAKPINSFATFPSTRNDGGTKNGRLQFDHRQDDQSFPQHENIKQTGETIVGQEFVGDTAASATRGDMGDGF